MNKDEIETDIKSLRGQRVGLKAQIADSETQIKSFMTQLNNVEGALIYLQQKLDKAMKEEIEEEIKKTKQKTKQVEKEIDITREKTKTIEEKIITLKEKENVIQTKDRLR